jgi:hypothetical protein
MSQSENVFESPRSSDGSPKRRRLMDPIEKAKWILSLDDNEMGEACTPINSQRVVSPRNPRRYSVSPNDKPSFFIPKPLPIKRNDREINPFKSNIRISNSTSSQSVTAPNSATRSPPPHRSASDVLVQPSPSRRPIPIPRSPVPVRVEEEQPPAPAAAAATSISSTVLNPIPENEPLNSVADVPPPNNHSLPVIVISRKMPHRFTAEEKALLEHGVAEFGHAWEKIKNNYKSVFGNLTGGQLKDAYRVILRNKSSNSG